MKEKFMRFMYGRYGVDQFSKFLVTVSLIGFVLSMFTGNNLFYVLALAALIYAYF